MKKLLLILCSALVIASCDYVNNPLQDVQPADTSSTNIVKRKVLVEDYTGHKCPHCPKAAVVANQLKQLYPDNVVLLTLHVGSFSIPGTPSGAPSGSYTSDFTTSTGSSYNTTFAFYAYPSGLINRKDYTPATYTHIKTHPTWAQELASVLANAPDADLSISNSYNPTSRVLNTTIVSKFLNASLPNATYKLVALITQDSIVDWQWDADASPVHIQNYVHQHVLRDAINSTWGDVLISGSITANSPISKNYTYTLPAAYKGNTCNDKHCYVLAFIYNTTTFEIIQAAEAKITN